MSPTRALLRALQFALCACVAALCASAARGRELVPANALGRNGVNMRARAASAKGRTPDPLPGGPLTRANPTPLPPSRFVVGARWTSRRYDPPANQRGDILPTVWADDGGTYVMMDDGGVDVPTLGGLWRQSIARIDGTPPRLAFRHVGNPFAPPPRTFAEIHGNPALDTGPLGPYYSSGFVEVDHVFYATQQRDWGWSGNSPFTGLEGIAYSTNHGRTWRFPAKPFDAPLGNLTWIARGPQGGSHPDGYVYALGTEREFNGSELLLGRVRPGIANITTPARWQWLAVPGAAGGASRPRWTTSFSSAATVLRWNSHLTYPQISYDAPLRRYLLTFTYSYSLVPPAIWTGGAELVILEAPHPWGPFSFVASSHEFGPSNGYDPGFPPQWISVNGRDLWLKWAANFDGCSPGLNCGGKYGFNLARVSLTLAGAGRR
jgi:hypothetical protein